MLFKQFTQLNKLNTLRQFATQASLTQFNPATLHLKSGQSFTGRAFGADKSSFGETVFTTSVTSYTESMTDPSYKGQLLVFTTPLIGNYGVPNNPSGNQGQYTPEMMLESSGIQCSGVIVADVAEKFSHYEAVESLHEWCKRHNIPGITGVDTRAITTILRDQGTTLGQIAVGGAHEKAPEEYFDPSPINLIAEASTKSPYTLNEKGDVHVAVMDFGSKANIIRSLLKRDAKVTVLPWDYDFYSNRDKFDALFLSNGPGDPRHASIAVENLKKTVSEYTKPIFGICMGHQLLGLAAGLEAYRMTFGNRGHNQPVLALGSSGSIKQGRVYVTSQNHQYALKLEEQFPDGWEPFFINCNDSSVEGIKSSEESGKKIWGVQFHPEAYGGPLDTIDMFTDFVDAAKKMKAQ